MSEKLLKEAFISHLNGTSLTEISVGLTVSPLCVVGRGMLLIFYHLQDGEHACSWSCHLLLDFTLLVIPLVLSCTILSHVLALVPLFLFTFSAIVLYKLYTNRNNYARVCFQEIVRALLDTQLDSDYVPSVTVLRVLINLLTAIAILAVDFPFFPRRYAKTETFGTGVMDFGVGGYVFANALVSPEARQRCGILQMKGSVLVKQIKSVWPLVFLGLSRFISVKAVDYHEHISEYGVHWNFFFTLALVRVIASLLLTIFSLHKSWIVAAAIAVLYQLIIAKTNLKMFILYGSDGAGTREGFLNANREGLFSVFGYVAIYMAGLQVGLYVLKKRNTIREWIDAICYLLVTSLVLFTFFHFLQVYVEVASRRMANLTFVVWIVAQCLSFFIFIFIADLILAFGTMLVKGSTVPCSWNILSKSNRGKKIDNAHSFLSTKGIDHPSFCLLDAISRNQLSFFLLANVLTGLVNMSIDTIHSSNIVSLSVLLLYMFCNCLVMYILHINNITLKCW